MSDDDDQYIVLNTFNHDNKKSGTRTYPIPEMDEFP